MVATVTLATYGMGRIERMSVRMTSDCDSQGQPGGDYTTALICDLSGAVLKINITGSRINNDGGLTNNAWITAIMALIDGSQATNAGGGGNALSVTSNPTTEYVQLSLAHAYIEDFTFDWSNDVENEVKYSISLIAGTGL